MDSVEFRNVLDTLGITQREARKVLFCDERTVRRWANDESPIPTPLVMLLRLVIRQGLPPQSIPLLGAAQLRATQLKAYKRGAI
jgi:hypothetical protein